MDISFINKQEKFYYKVCGIIIKENKILAMKDDKSSYLLLARWTSYEW